LITIVILNYKRPDNIRKQIIPNLLSNKLIENIIVSHALPETYFEDFQEFSKVIHLKHFEENKKDGLFCRFLAANLSKTKCIAFHDDDFLIKNNSIKNCYYEWMKNKTSIHGFTGRDISENKYFPPNCHTNRPPIILTHFAMTSKFIINKVINKKNLIDSFVRDCIPIWNGEDIFLSFISMLVSGKLNFLHAFDFKKLDESYAIHKNEGHFKHRTLLVKKLFDVFPKIYDVLKINNYKELT